MSVRDVDRLEDAMQRGDVWWVELDERRPVVLLSDETPSGFDAMQVVAPSGVDISGLGIEVPIGPIAGLPVEGVVRIGFPRPGLVPCTWRTMVSADRLIERVGTLSAATLNAIDDALRAGTEAADLTPAATTRLNEIRAALRSGVLKPA